MATIDHQNAQIFQAFQQILTEQDNIDSRIATKAEQAELTKRQSTLAVASTYTVDGIVKGLAELQLTFGSDIQVLSEQLLAEIAKLDQLEQAIEVETQHLRELQQIRVVADALHLLIQSHQEQLSTLEQDTARQRQTLEQEIADQRQVWQQEQADFDHTVTAKQALLTKDRQRQEADYQYELDRTRTIAVNEYEEKERIQEQELQEFAQGQEQKWLEREAILADHQSRIKQYQQQVEDFPAELAAAVQQASAEATATVEQAAQVAANLLEKEWEATEQGHTFQVQALEATIARQIEQMDALNLQLQDALKQSQALTIKAFENSSNVDPQKQKT